MIQDSSLDRLYLLKSDDGDIYVDRKLPQHQIDGLRFLYRQFKKKNPGVILNDPPGYGKRVQTVLFLNALTRILVKRMLILCSENDCERWSERFREWTDLSEPDVGVYHQTNLQTDPFLKRRKVCIMPLTKGTSVASRRAWSVIVVDDETRKGLQASMSIHNVDFKILITTMDMKENLESFFSIYEWLYPKGKLNVRKVFEDEKHTVSKSVLINALMEDIVLRRNDFLTRFIEAEKINKCIESKPVVTRKNKDATGTKIKRSKRKLHENHTLHNNNTEKNHDHHKKTVSAEIYKENENSDLEMDIETFIRNTKPIGFENYDKYVDNTSESGVDDTTEVDRSGIKTPIASDTSNSGSVRLFEDSRLENIPRRLTIDSDLAKDIEETIDDNSSYRNKDGRNIIDCDTSNSLSLEAKINENKVHDNDLSYEVEELEDELVSVIYNNDILRNIDTIAVDCEVSNNETVTIKLVDDCDSVSDQPKELIHDIGTTHKVNGNQSVATTTTDAKDTEVEKGHKTIDDKILEIEQTALKKFKGSLLDRIF